MVRLQLRTIYSTVRKTPESERLHHSNHNSWVILWATS